MKLTLSNQVRDCSVQQEGAEQNNRDCSITLVSLKNLDITAQFCHYFAFASGGFFFKPQICYSFNAVLAINFDLE